MGMVRKFLSIVFLLLFVFCILAGCQTAETTGGTTTGSTTTGGTTTGGTTTTSGSGSGLNLDDINLDSHWPVIKEGSEVPTIKFYTTQMGGPTGNAADHEKNWYLQYLKNKSGLNIEYTQIMQDSLLEQKSLIFNSGDIPDVLYSFSLTATELMDYGQGQGLILDLRPYITNELTPTMVARLNETPTAVSAITLPNGGIYSIPRIDNPANEAGVFCNPWNTEVLAQMGKELPETLDEAIDILYQFKEEDPLGLGADNWPIGGADSYWMLVDSYYLNAFGFQAPGRGNELSLNKDGKVCYTAYEDVFAEYLKLMSAFYKDGIIHPDYYTMDSAALNALCIEGNLLQVNGPAFVLVPEGFEKFWSSKPLTSEWNPSPIMGKYLGIMIGGMVLSAQTEYPEAIMRIADWFFTEENAIYTRRGPFEDTEDTYGLFETGWHLEEDDQGNWVTYYGDVLAKDLQPPTNQLFLPSYNESAGITSNYWGKDGILGTQLMQKWAGMPVTEFKYDLTNGDSHYRAHNAEQLLPYQKDLFPTSVFYFTQEENDKIADLVTTLNDHARNEIAKFVTGVRDLSTFPAFQEELKTMGVEDYIAIYDNAYQVFKANLEE